MDAGEGYSNRVAKYLYNIPNDTIDTAEFRSACCAFNVVLGLFSQADFKGCKESLINFRDIHMAGA